MTNHNACPELNSDISLRHVSRKSELEHCWNLLLIQVPVWSFGGHGVLEHLSAGRLLVM